MLESLPSLLVLAPEAAEAATRGDQIAQCLAGNIDQLVKAVSEQVRAIKPNVELSAAVFRDWPIHCDEVGLDWKVWCEQGWREFICPMDYNPNNRTFENIVTQQMRWVGRLPCYPASG